MATKELDAVRRKYRSAYTLYMHCVHELADASQRGEWPSAFVEAAEERAFNDLALARQVLLDALYAHTVQGIGGSNSK
jgi:hypothetical protein